MFPPSLLAQTDYSLRMYSLGTTFAGIIEDLPTDVFLNPARAGFVEQREVHAGVLPGRTYSIPFPSAAGMYSRYNTILIPNEDHYMSFSYTPVLLGAFLPIGGTRSMFVGFEAAVSHDERLSSDGQVEIRDDYSGAYARTHSSETVDRNNRSHYLVDAGVAWGIGGGSVGLRARVSFERYENSDWDSYETTRTRIRDFGDSYLEMSNNSSEFRFERLSTSVSLGVSGIRRVLRDLVFTLERVGYTYPVEQGGLDYNDDDLDGNGISYYGGTPTIERTDYMYDSNRDYTELGFSVRVHLEPGAGFRTAHYFSYRFGDGEGDASSNARRFETNTPYDRLKDVNLIHDYDGSFSRVYALTTVGRVEEIHRGVVLAWGLSGVYSRWKFDEGGSGDLDLLISDEYYPDSLRVTSPYEKKHHDLETRQYLSIPFALEWKINKFIVLRLGAKLTASRRKLERSYMQAVDVTDFQSPVVTEPVTHEYSVEYSVYSVFDNGVGITFKDRLRIDLYHRFGGFDFAEYDLITASYSF